MSTVVDARLSAEEFALAKSLIEHPRARFEFSRAIAQPSDDTMPFLWGSGVDLDALYDALQDDPAVADVSVMSRFDDEYLLEVDWSGHVATLFEALLSHQGSALLNAYSSGTSSTSPRRTMSPSDISVVRIPNKNSMP